MKWVKWARRPEGPARNVQLSLLETESVNDARLFDRLTGRPGVTPEIPQVKDSKRRGLFCFCQLNIRRYRFVYFGYQSVKDVFFQLHTRVHNVTFHNYLFLLIYNFVTGTRRKKPL